MAICPSFKPVLDLLCITYPQDLVLHFLWEQDGRTIGHIAERLSLESSTVTPLVKRLEAGGFLTRARSAADERRVDVRLMERGAAMREECGCMGEAQLERSGMDGAQQADIKGRGKPVGGALRDDRDRDDRG